jgi:hypothetical protein
MFLLAPPAIALFAWIFGEVVMHLWNWLLPMLFGWRQISFWQALGLLILCRILFGGFGGHGHDRGSAGVKTGSVCHPRSARDSVMARIPAAANSAPQPARSTIQLERAGTGWIIAIPNGPR